MIGNAAGQYTQARECQGHGRNPNMCLARFSSGGQDKVAGQSGQTRTETKWGDEVRDKVIDQEEAKTGDEVG
jgi:hypothetical protein